MQSVVSKSYFSQYSETHNQALNSFFIVLGGVVLISVLAQISIPLPFTPVPVTGQTFAVSLIGLVWGRKFAPLVLASYLILGFVGLPIFAMGKAGFLMGPTFGYLIGMFFASSLIGYLADKGFSKNLGLSLLVNYGGSIVTFLCGLFVLSFFIPSDQLLAAGLIPFLPGDLIKNLLSASLATWINKKGS